MVSLHHGCGGVAVSTIGCGPVSPGSSPGHGPTLAYQVRIVSDSSVIGSGIEVLFVGERLDEFAKFANLKIVSS